MKTPKLDFLKDQRDQQALSALIGNIGSARVGGRISPIPTFCEPMKSHAINILNERGDTVIDSYYFSSREVANSVIDYLKTYESQASS